MTQTPVISRGIRSSVEGLNQEIERLVLINSSQLNIEREEDRVSWFLFITIVVDVIFRRDESHVSCCKI